jgi:hypothetical protein
MALIYREIYVGCAEHNQYSSHRGHVPRAILGDGVASATADRRDLGSFEFAADTLLAGQHLLGRP